MRTSRRKLTSGFTIVELLIVIVVIAILAAISVVAYTGVQARARDSQRMQDIKTITKALEMYYVDNGGYPGGLCSPSESCAINTGWSNTNDGSWENLEDALVPEYISELPSDPNPTTGSSPISGNTYGYAYFATRSNSNYCGSSNYQAYILVYTLESSPQQNTLNGACTDNPVGPYSNKSNYRVAIGGS